MSIIHDSRRLASLLAILALLSAPAVFAEDGGTSTVEGEVSIGGHVSDVSGEIGRVSEYELNRESVEPDLHLDLFGWSGTNRWNLLIKYLDEKTLDLNGRLEAGPYVDARFDHRSFIHWLDHDRMANLQWRELAGVDSLGNDIPGGKMITHEDSDPMGRYSIRYSETKGGVDVAIPGLPNTKVHAGFRTQVREGTRQVLAVDHCASCHVQGQSSDVDEETRDLTLGLSTGTRQVSFSYEFLARDFENRADGSEHYYQLARHPVNGGNVDEFNSRLNYSDETLPIHRTPDVEKRGHSARATVELPKSNVVRGAFSYSQVKNMNTHLELTANAAAVGWFAPLTQKLRATAGVSRREIENDPYFVDLAPWRADRAGGGQDFDFERLSAYDREEYTGTAALVYAVRPGHSLRLDHRIQSIDRDNVVLDPDDESDRRTLRNRIRASWSGRLSKGSRSRASVEYEVTDLPFVNVHGICEDGIGDTVMPIDDDQPNNWIYYFQRERIGTGANLPTKALRARANLNRRFGHRVSGSLYVNFADEKNDDLNLYDFERTVISSGLSAYVTPGNWGVLTGGVAYSRIESNAKFCATVMDG